MKIENRIRRNLSDYAFQIDIEEGRIDTPSTGSPFGISAVTKSIIGVAF